MGRPRKIKLETVEPEGELKQVVPVGRHDIEEAAAELDALREYQRDMFSQTDGLNSDER